MALQKDLDKVYLNIDKEISTLSKCVRAKVGSIIVKDGNILGMGYNGMPTGVDNCCEDKVYIHSVFDVILPKLEDYPFTDELGRYKLVSKVDILHSESNAILKAAKMGISINNSTIYCTLSPCRECSKLILQSGIKKVVFSEVFKRNNGAIEFLKQFIEVEQYAENI